MTRAETLDAAKACVCQNREMARIKTGMFKEDSFVDACGYMACAAELAKGE